jgi:hypothetical protein
VASNAEMFHKNINSENGCDIIQRIVYVLVIYRINLEVDQTKRTLDLKDCRLEHYSYFKEKIFDKYSLDSTWTN